jgi:transposase
MPKGYRAYLPEQDLLLPPSLRAWLEEGHLAYFVSDVVDQLDLSAIHEVYEKDKEKRGQPPYDPLLMTKLLVYGYCTGVFSSRRIQKRLKEDIPLKVLAAGNEPNFRTISDFRKKKRWRNCLSKSWRWQGSAGRSNWAGCRWTGPS